ncbi:MAG: hypothetical protein COU35_02085 [Candidatus Magasanikbacteria bacterium CG10_big_fil_rev_8_21_14_0_10_47_10]|uniref:Uncharacterized protein n=1 Tax=Candidatus Magasanikbacteria bacterium CG10_big_fil_rev_8_21_14_0_10_47_10 TaxID=1974652 RepID=A0A2H0TQV2_9BACT|nr:MAG: hypothetical protein COU35_02085 [Candidatus Magasanikbacteria bacterium CG10_big_fil_rev_8_21_14_0_10_47_10]
MEARQHEGTPEAAQFQQLMNEMTPVGPADIDKLKAEAEAETKIERGQTTHSRIKDAIADLTRQSGKSSEIGKAIARRLDSIDHATGLSGDTELPALAGIEQMDYFDDLLQKLQGDPVAQSALRDAVGSVKTIEAPPKVAFGRPPVDVSNEDTQDNAQAA